MQLGSSNSVDTTTILGFVRQLTNTLDNVNTFPDAIIKASFNRKQHNIQLDILRETGWQVSGTTAQQNLTADTVSYNFPTGFLTIDRMEANYQNGTNTWVVVTPIEFDAEENRAYNNTSNNAAIRGSEQSPMYIPYGTTAFSLDPAPRTTVSNGIKIYYTSKLSDLSGSTDESSLVEALQEFICYDTAIELSIPKGKNTLIDQLRAERKERWTRGINFYLSRLEDRKKRIKRKNVRIR